ncbi:MAG: bifunctional 5,10-methylenetetrahydrofolate dehydrogenase/5,10-methenyltetrahydrofolate cyclohydrolase [Chloroflexi bacterium]|nr:bifunctional 5,10-methylenetetrahydrofolate dehydrogenase/5,10-methenyltetrahydrofolate cyclohydrolase [Chloroflexota bacterium]
MTAKVIDGVQIAQQVRDEVAASVRDMARRRGVTPGLAVVLVGDNPASASYVRGKEKACQEVGIVTETFHLPGDATEGQVLALVEQLNSDSRYHGILTQLPFPPQVHEATVVRSLNPAKDVDGLHPYSEGLLAMGEPRFIPATPYGIQQLLVRTGNDPAGKHVVVCGRSNLVGRPLALLLAQKQEGANATVTLCHTGTRDLAYFTRQADILVAAMGRPWVIKGEMVKPGAVVIDVGINRVEDKTRRQGYRLVGDVDYDAVKEAAGAITPVPGGVGPMTVAMLLVNTLKAAQLAEGRTDPTGAPVASS